MLVNFFSTLLWYIFISIPKSSDGDRFFFPYLGKFQLRKSYSAVADAMTSLNMWRDFTFRTNQFAFWKQTVNFHFSMAWV